MLSRRAKRAFLIASKYLGLFFLARLMTRKRLRILCYHGFSLADEHRFREKLFVTPEQFRQRMQFLADAKYPVLTLSQGVDRLKAGTLPAGATVITIDDGFAGVYMEARSILVEMGFPATLYLTTYYFEKQTPIYRLLVSYILWRTADGSTIDLSGLGVPGLENAAQIVLTSVEKERLSLLIRDYGEMHCDEPTRQSIAAELARVAGLDYEELRGARILNLISEREAAELERVGIGIEPHTHRHTFPTDASEAARELTECRNSIARVLGKGGTHFCYPSGEWSTDHWPVLEEFGMTTATTCEAGLACADSHRFALPRILDSTEVSQIEFESALSGYTDLVRHMVRGVFRLRRATPAWSRTGEQGPVRT